MTALSETDWWFDGDFSECYYAPGHVSKLLFAVWVNEQEEQAGEELVMAKDVEHIYALELNAERFIDIAHPPADLYEDIKARIKPMTRYRP